MTLRTLISRSLRHHWRAHLGVTLGAAIGSAALIGALVVGDSVKGSLRERALERVGKVSAALKSGDRFIGANLAASLQVRARKAREQKVGGTCAPVLWLEGVAVSRDGTARANRIQVLGVNERFTAFGGESWQRPVSPGCIRLNHALAHQLHAKPQDEILVRIRKASALSAESPISSRSGLDASLRLRVESIVEAGQLGNFSLLPASAEPWNGFVELATLQQAMGLQLRANVVLAESWPVAEYLSVPHGVVSLFELVGLGGRFIAAEDERGNAPYPTGRFLPVPDLLERLQSRLQRVWQLSDTGVTIQISPDGNALELRSPKVFLDPPISRRAMNQWENVGYGALTEEVKRLHDVSKTLTNSQPILTYLANLLHAGTNATPYSMVTAAGPPWTPSDMRDDETLVSQWLADDLRVKPGDEVALSYFDPESGARLVERTNTFRVRGVVPQEMPWADRTLMPDFPGIEKAESTSEWDAGFPLTYKVRPKDDEYWKQHRGTPKAFITLAAGQKMWGNRFGNLTAVRFPIPTNVPLTPALSPSEGARENPSPSQSNRRTDDSSRSVERSNTVKRLSPLPEGEGQGEGKRRFSEAEAYRAALEKKILANLKPEELGLRFEPVREQALRAAEQSQDFGGLFLGFSFFLIAAALLLMAMLFQLGLEQRAPEIGTLLALGFTPGQVRKLLFGEGVALAFVGGALGTLGGLAYAKAMLHGLATIWRDAVGATTLSFHVTLQTLAIGLFASVVVSVVTIWLTLRKFVRREPRELLAGEIEESESKDQRPKSKVIALGALMAALALVGWMLARGDTANAGAFFGAGALVLIAGLGFASSWLANVLRISCPQNPLSSSTADPQKEFDLPAGRRQHVSLGSLGLRGCARRRKRSLATVAMLACGSFLIVSIGVFRLDANRDATQRSSGTGGFALIGETTLPVVQDLNSSSGRDFFALKEEDLKGVSFVPFRVREGDEASCLNLNRAQKPRLLGVKPELLERRFAFTKGDAWQSLKSQIANRKSEMAEVPAIGDANSIQWAMGKQVGDTLDYVDERGQPFKVRIVGAVANSILQGQLIIDEAEFVKRFPGESGYRQFLIDAPTNRVTEVSTTLSRAMQDVGLELTPAAQRLAEFNAVQNTYLGTFQVLGGLGLLLGSVGLGIVVLRNVLERRGELAVLLAVGFRKPTLQRLLLIENGALLVLGLTLGVAAAAVAVLPALLSPGTQLPWLTLALTLAAVLSNGALWTWAATRVALRGDLLAALRNE